LSAKPLKRGKLFAMCLIAWNWQPDSDTPLLLIGNRDEFYARPTQTLHWWDSGHILAGRDLQAGGTWLGVNRKGQLAALTNYRSPPMPGAPSRGELVAEFLNGSASAADYLALLAARCADYAPFNLLVYDGQCLMGLESRAAKVLTMSPGVGAVSNADFQTPWPKLALLKNGLTQAVNMHTTSHAVLTGLLHHAIPAADADLPRTGLPLERERALSSAFIATPDYGTRTCSVVRIARDKVVFTQDNFGPTGPEQALTQSFAIEH
jgi:uncharacterized protein with NRDE domain